jgi:DNA-binding transcriptional LysR family regulator
MINVPMDLLRTFVAVNDMRSFTRAAHALGVTQPAVSAQIKRLQMLLGAELFDKSAPGVTLTARGEITVSYARRVLALNDQMIDATASGGPVPRIRIGLTNDYFEGEILGAVAAFSKRHPELRLQIVSDSSASILRDLRRGDYDLAVAASDLDFSTAARRRWLEPSTWGARSAAVVNHDGPISLLTIGENSLSRKLSVESLERAGQRYEIIHVAGTFSSLVHAAQAGLGVVCWARRLIETNDLEVLDHPRLPRMPDVIGGVHVRDGLEDPQLNELADMVYSAINSGIEPDVRVASGDLALSEA